VIENIADVSDRFAPNCAAIGLKNAPKLYTTPNSVKAAMKPATTMRHAWGESRSNCDRVAPAEVSAARVSSIETARFFGSRRNIARTIAVRSRVGEAPTRD
jgi:hypothetical protein